MVGPCGVDCCAPAIEPAEIEETASQERVTGELRDIAQGAVQPVASTPVACALRLASTAKLQTGRRDMP